MRVLLPPGPAVEGERVGQVRVAGQLRQAGYFIRRCRELLHAWLWAGKQ